MNACFDGDIEATELILKIILNKPDITVKRVTTQKVMKNLLGRDIWLDVDADDAEGITYDIEIQRSLPESYVIFITEHDVIGRNLPIYFIKNDY